MIEAIRTYIAGGLSAIPCNSATKQPLCGPWAAYQKGQATEAKIFDWGRLKADAVAIVCGFSGVEMIDIDVKHGNLIADFERLLGEHLPGLLERLYVEDSQSGGRHYFYRAPEGWGKGNTKLANRPLTDVESVLDGAKMFNLIETRGVGGYAIVAPSAGYKAVSGSLLSLPSLTEDEVSMMWDVARSLNTYVEEEQRPAALGADGRPGDDFNARVSESDLLSLLSTEGWRQVRKFGGRTYLNRPGAAHSRRTDAELIVQHDKKLLVVYSASGSASLRGGAAYSPFNIYAHLQHQGDFKSAAKELAGLGYGSASAPAAAPQREAARSGDWRPSALPQAGETAALKRFSLSEVPSEKFNLFVREDGRYSSIVPIAAPGMLVSLFGASKSRKTTVLGAIIASALRGGPVLRFNYAEAGEIVWIDTEQGATYFYMTMARILAQAGVSSDIDRFSAYSLNGHTKRERREMLKSIVEMHPDCKVLVLDGAVDFVRDYNDLVETGEFVQEVMSICRRGTTVFNVLHLTKGDKTPRGHLGNFLVEKSDASFRVLQLAEDPNQSEVGLHSSRGGTFSPFTLTAGKYGILCERTMPDYDFTALDRFQEEQDRNQLAAEAQFDRQTDHLGLEPSQVFKSNFVRMSEEDLPF